MRIDRVKYTQHYDEFGNLKDVWVGMDGSLDNAEVPEAQLDKIKKITEQWYQSRHPQASGQCPPMHFAGSVIGPRVIEVKPEDRTPGITVEDIKSCNELVVIDSYKLIVNMKGNEMLKDAWKIRREEIVAKEVKEILDATNALTEQISANPELKSKLLDGYNKNTKVKK